MRALSVKQPWAGLIASGIKSLEIRTWSTAYRGPLLIVASLKAYTGPEADGWEGVIEHAREQGAFGVAIAQVTLHDVRPARRTDSRLCGGFDPTRFPGALAWVLTDPRPVRPTPIKGSLGLFNVPDSLVHVTRRSRRRAIPKGMRTRYYTLGQAMRAVFEHIEPYSVFGVYEVAAEEPVDSKGKLVAEIRAAEFVPRWSRGVSRTPRRWGDR